ncbi:MAG: spore cortex biosynthesis protein YabQ [Lachnoclostridium sp.]|nr:spore cortex biosynthesis protein YabQ [Lachnospira sp.]MCM1248887.1 spore cortex biosynthesis protein YabQ [Lachnoclostridium sp.]MCM1535373.1 spore cortex biosynthesis protein YabQ [Clostridium sp.]
MASENIFLVYALLMGIFITFIYDILRIARRVFPHGGFLVSLEDLGFWVYCATEVFMLMYRFSDGVLRWFAVLGALVGMFLYKKLVSPFFVKYVSLGLLKVKGFLGKIIGFLLKPVRFLGRKVKLCMKKAVAIMRARAFRYKQRSTRTVKKKLTHLLKVLKMTI